MSTYIGQTTFKTDTTNTLNEHCQTADARGYIINPYFSEAELDCKGSGVLMLEPAFMEALIALRQDYGQPLYVNSCCRSPEHNKRIGGHKRSLHLTTNTVHRNKATGELAKTCAIDINRRLLRNERRFKRLARKHGFTLGIANGFIHIDLRTTVVGLRQTTYYYKGAE